MATYHIWPQGDGKYDVEKDGCKHATSKDLDKKTAEKVAKELSTNHKTKFGTVIDHEEGKCTDYSNEE